MPMVFSMMPLHSLDHSDQNDVKHDSFMHVMPLVPAMLSCATSCIISGTICFQYVKVEHNSYGLLMLLAPVQAPHDTDDIVNGTICLLDDGQINSMWDSKYTGCGFKSQCCQLVDDVTSLGKMWAPCMPHYTKV